MNRIIAHLILCLSGSAIIIEFESCCSYNQSFQVSNYGKNWIAYAGTSVSFENDSGEVVSFQYSQTTTGSFEGSHGEECGDYCDIEVITTSLTGLSIDFEIYADNNCYGAEQLDITCGNQYLYVFRLMNDTIESMHPVIYHDHFSINGKDFQQVYVSDSLQDNPSLLVKCYLTKTEGIVGYETIDGRIWGIQ